MSVSASISIIRLASLFLRTYWMIFGVQMEYLLWSRRNVNLREKQVLLWSEFLAPILVERENGV